jgi:hypothetical protein
VYARDIQCTVLLSPYYIPNSLYTYLY